MRWQTTAILAVVLVALGAFYYVWEVRLGPAREQAEARRGRVVAAELADVVELELKRAADTVRVRREEGGWRMLAPVAARGDRGRIEETLTTFVTARSDREIAAAPAAVAEFGLDKPAVEATLRLKDGRQLGLVLGAKSPTGAWVYAREPGKPAVFLVSDTVLRDATRPLAELRDKTVLAFDQGAVTGFEIVLPEATLAVERAGAGWKLVRPRALPADSDSVREFLDKLDAARVTAFVAEQPKALAAFGLDRPVRLALHTGRDKERASKTLLLGRVDPAKKGVYAMRPGESSVLLLPEAVWAALPKNVAVLRDRVVVVFERDRVTGLDLEGPKGRVTLAREKDRWRITAPEALPADQVEVGAVLFRLRELRAQGFLTDDASGIPRYLARPGVRLTLSETGGRAQTLLLAPSPERRGGAPSAYAALAGRGPVVLVPATALEELGRSLTELRDRTLFPALEPRDVKRLRLTAGGTTVVLERSGDAAWRFVEGARGAAKSTGVENLLFMLRALKWKEIAAPKGEEPARYGLDAPTFEAALLRADGSEAATLRIGKRDDGRAWVRAAGPAIYAVDAAQLGDLPRLPDDLKG